MKWLQAIYNEMLIELERGFELLQRFKHRKRKAEFSITFPFVRNRRIRGQRQKMPASNLKPPTTEGPALGSELTCFDL